MGRSIAARAASPRPGDPAPDLTLPMLDGGPWPGFGGRGEPWLMMIVYRGHFCPHCRRQMLELVELRPELAARGVALLLASADDEARAALARDEWGLGDIPVAYGLALADMRRWGLFSTKAFFEAQAPIHAEPALFLISTADKSIFYSNVASAPFGRPPLAEMLRLLDRVQERPGAAWGQD